MSTAPDSGVKSKRLRPSAVAGFGIVHLVALGAFVVGVSWEGIALCIGSYYLRMFGLTAGFHRYFSHRTYQLGRVPQFALAFLGQTSAQRGVLWWASNHRHHHRWSDLPPDVHSPVQRGFWWGHIGWILSEDWKRTDLSRIPDLARYRELRWLDRHEYLPTILYAVAMFLAFGWVGLFWGYFLSTVLLWHGTFLINSAMHLVGRRVFPTVDDSRNSFLFAVLTMGEGWHNNHHHFPGSAAQGFKWWQIDATYAILRGLQRIGIVRQLHRVPARLKATPEEHPGISPARLAVERGLEVAGLLWTEKIRALTRRWIELRDAAWATAHHAVEDLEAARVHAAERLEGLHAEALELKSKAGMAGQRRLEEIQADIDRCLAHLVETLERLVAAAETALGGVVAEPETV
jgi:stearoyl-CoA desaturase (delta-9 desaturase)